MKGNLMSDLFEDGYFSGLPAPAEPEFLPGDEEEWYFDEELDLYMADGWDYDPVEFDTAW
jgi:hypothetical protein